MSETPRRKRFQIHLSTAVLMMIAAGILIWVNTTRRPHLVHYRDKSGRELIKDTSRYGWPLDIWTQSVNRVEYEPGQRIAWEALPGDALDPPGINIVLDLAAAVFILFGLWFVCEWLIRRRAARKGT